MKCYYKFFTKAGIAALLIAATSCSDDAKEYADDVYFTASQPAVTVIGSSASSTPGEGAPALNVCFDAAGNWQIAAKQFDNPSQVADWVSFYTSAGEEGSQRLGLYVTANATGKDRAATIEISSNGKSAAFTLVQQASVVIPNPNAASISPNKVIKRIEHYSLNETTPFYTEDYSYAADGTLSGISTKSVVNDKEVTGGYSVEVEGRSTTAGVGINKVTVTPVGKLNSAQSFAVINGKTAIGYSSAIVKNNTNESAIAFDYNIDNHPTSIKGVNVSTALSWRGNNLVEAYDAYPVLRGYEITYGNELNDCNLDLNWILCPILDGFNNVLGMMNLLGKRSTNLLSDVDPDFGQFTYTSGVTTSTGSQAAGLTISNEGLTIKVFFAE